ncbi:MAG: ATP-binding protein [Lachnospiraceae bacterium]|nr:ATP-binding protein [Lachnospiraceae bacterium]
MSLTTSEYDSLLREYEQRQLDGEMDLRRRREEVTRDVPAIAEIEEQIVHGSVQAARLALAGNSSALDALSRTNDWLIKQKHQLLTGAGYPADYLDRRYICPICKDTGTETVSQPDGSIVRRPCSCFRRAIIDRYYMDDGLRERLARENFTTFDLRFYSSKKIDEATGQTYREIAETALGDAKDYAARFGSEYRNLLISGYSGVGKTFLANCITGELLSRGFTVLYLSAFRLFEIFEHYRFGDRDASKQASLDFDNILDCDLLIVDDLGTEMSNSYTTSQLFVCLEERDREKKPTLITTNLTMDDLSKRYSERIASRLFQFRYIKLFADDIRIQSMI